jgi:hypothetical protein
LPRKSEFAVVREQHSWAQQAKVPAFQKNLAPFFRFNLDSEKYSSLFFSGRCVGD